MAVASLTSKGQVTIPVELRNSLGLKAGDKLLFELAEDGKSLRVQPLRRKRLSELYGALPATKTYPGREELRREVGEALARDLLDRSR